MLSWHTFQNLLVVHSTSIKRMLILSGQMFALRLLCRQASDDPAGAQWAIVEYTHKDVLALNVSVA